MTWTPIPRRTFLRGVGTAIALPLLEGMRSLGRATAQEAPGVVPPMPQLAPAPGEAPRRLAFWFVPNGAHMPDWKPETVGAEFELPAILKPLAPVREWITVLTGLTHDKARANGDGAGDHARCAATFLTGAQAVKTSGKNIHVGTSVDQVAAREIGHVTRLPSLELGCEEGPQAGRCDSGYSCAYVTNIAWRSPTTPVVKEVNPQAVFDRLFGAGDSAARTASRARRKRARQSILDLAQEDARRLRKKLGTTDRRKLDEYLDSIRELEQRIGRPATSLEVDGELRRPDDAPRDFGQHLRIMGDLMVLAFRADVTRISTFMLANAGSNRSYREIDIREGHHSLSHHQGDDQKQEKISRINRFHVEQLAYILQKMQSIDEQNGTLLDHTMLVYGSAIGDGNRHNHDDLPIVVAGRGGGTIDAGRHVRFADETPLMNLYLALLDRMGVPVDHAGDSTGRLGGLQA